MILARRCLSLSLFALLVRSRGMKILSTSGASCIATQAERELLLVSVYQSQGRLQRAWPELRVNPGKTDGEARSSLVAVPLGIQAERRFPGRGRNRPYCALATALGSRVLTMLNTDVCDYHSSFQKALTHVQSCQPYVKDLYTGL